MFKCLGTGHIASQCLNKMAMILSGDGDIKIDSYSYDDPMPSLEDIEDIVEYIVIRKLMVIRHTLNMQVKEDVEVQRDNNFHIKCPINNKVCSMIIDCGSYTNIASLV